jgi:uncharacterized protein YukE
MKAILVGGGNAATTLLNFFDKLKDMTVLSVSDPREDAPGIVRARSLGIPTTTHTEELLSRPDVDMVVELTGNPKVQDGIIKHLRTGQEIMTAASAKLMCDMIEAQSARNSKLAETIAEKFTTSVDQMRAAIERMDAAYSEIEKLLREAGLVTLNAKIESARAGDAGSAFAIVVDRMHEMLASIRGAMEKISDATAEGHDTVEKLKTARDQLADVFHLSKEDNSREIVPRPVPMGFL